MAIKAKKLPVYSLLTEGFPDIVCVCFASYNSTPIQKKCYI